MLKLILQYFGHLMWRVDSLEKTDAGRDWGQEEKGTTDDEMAGWHHWLDGRESEWTPGVRDGQGGLVCCDSWGRKESGMTEGLDWTELMWRSTRALAQHKRPRIGVQESAGLRDLRWIEPVVIEPCQQRLITQRCMAFFCVCCVLGTGHFPCTCFSCLTPATFN